MNGKTSLSLAASGLLSLNACGTAAQPEGAPGGARLPNPAVMKCIADGWRTEPQLSAAGVPIGTLCIDPRTGRRCEAWAYFRGECPEDKDSPEQAPAREEPVPRP